METIIKLEPDEEEEDGGGIFSIATNHSENFQEFGEVKIDIMQTKHCMKGSFTGYHVERRRGVLNARVSIKNESVTTNDSIWVRCTLVRQDPAYRHFPVETICSKHRREQSLPGMIPHVIQAVPQATVAHRYSEGYRNSVAFSGWARDNEWRSDISLRFMCSDSCRTSEDQHYQGNEASRDLYLMLTIERGGRVLGRKLISVWPKAKVVERDLEKRIRRRDKGGAEQKRRREQKERGGKAGVVPRPSLEGLEDQLVRQAIDCLLYTSPSPRDS